MRKGYKNTEVGVIPEDWEVKKLGDIGENIIGLTYSPNDVKSYGHLVLRSSNIQNNKLAFENNVFVEMELPNRVIVKENDILICVRNGSKHLIGKCALIDKATEGSAFGAFMSVYRTKNAEFIFHQFQSNIIQKQIDEVMGATINQLTNKDLSTFQIPLPKEDKEQTAIATALSDADALINSLEKLIAKKRNIKQGAMQELLRPKEGWEVKKLGEIFTFYSTANYSKAEMDFDGEIGCMHYGLIHAISNTVYSLENGVRYYLKGNKTEYETIKDGDIIMVDASEDFAGINKSVEVLGVGNRKFIAGLHTYLMRDENSLLVNNFRGLILNSNMVKYQLIKLAVGMKVYGVSKAQLKEILISIPSKTEQTRIATILSDMDAEIQALETKLEKYRNIKLGMMQNLLTGKIRLNRDLQDLGINKIKMERYDAR